MKLSIFLLVAISFVQDTVPFKPYEEFEIKLDYKFKQRPQSDINSVHLAETEKDKERRTSAAVLPFLTLNVRMIKLSEEEVKVRITNNMNSRVATRKIEEGTIVPIEIGFTDDAKDRVSAHMYILTFISPKKAELSKVVINIDSDGTFLVNGQKRGKF